MPKLNLGSGNYPLKKWKNIDIDLSVKPDECYDITKGIREENNSIDKILISHVLMYFLPTEIRLVLKECFRVLKKNGIIKITEDNRHLKKRTPKQQQQYHNGRLYDILEMIEFLRKVKFVDIKEVSPFKATKQHLNTSKNYPLASGQASVYFLKARKFIRTGPKVYLGLDDFTEANSQMDILWKLRNHFDNFKVNLFAVPSQSMRHEWLRYINSLKWIKLCIHGYNHTHFEELDDVVLKTITDKRINCFNKIYKAPFWELTKEMRLRLKRLGFKTIFFNNINWEICQPIPDLKEIHAYGHIYPHDYLSVEGNTGSSIFKFYENIKKLPKGTRFKLYESPRPAL